MDYRYKLLLSISVVSILMLFVIMFNRVFLLEDILIQKIVNKVNSIGNILSEEINDDVWRNDYDSLRQIFDLYAQQENIEIISAMNSTGIIICSTYKIFENGYNPYKDTVTRESYNTFDFKYEIFRDSINKNKARQLYIKSFPLIYQKKLVGTLQIGYSLLELHNDIIRIITRSFLTYGGATILILLVAWIISGRLLSPLLEMKNIASRIGQGDFSPRVQVRTRDIIGELGMSLNNMIEELDDLTKNLNRKVDQATHSLSETNLKLLDKTRQLEQSNQKLLELDRLKSDFVSIVSHELRTPLTGIIGFARTLLNLDLPNEQRNKYLHIIETEGKRLAELIEHFLDISKIESGNIEFNIELENLKAVVTETVESLQTQIPIVIDFPSDFPPIPMDKNRIKQVVMNIVANAIRYTPKGGKIIIQGIDSPRSVSLSIKDEGPGIPVEDQNKIFDKFFRCSDDISKKSRGSGLGLTISKKIIEMHQGNIRVESAEGEGSRFTFTLPKKNI